MKTKLAVAVMAIMVPLCIALVGFKPHTSATPHLPGPPPSNAVGYFDAQGSPHPLLNRLVKKFKNGGDITDFDFVLRNDGLNMVRRGTNISNGFRTETFKVNINAPWITYSPVWFTSCWHPTCAFCEPNPQKTECNCPMSTGGTCNFGMEGPEEVPVVIVE